MQDSAFNLDQYIAGRFAERLGRITSTHYATGTGSGQPNGLVTASTLGTTAAAVAAITYNEMLDLKHSVDPAYRGNAKWVFNDSTLKALKQLQDSNGLPLWSPNVATDAPAMLDNDPYIIDQGMPSLATGNKTVLYGDIAKYHIRDVRGFSMVRLVERYADFDQVGFIAFMRTDADLLDTAAVKHLIQA
jgi:HK97 family phage major capsid protein